MADDRTPPARVRLSRLQEAQVPDLVKIDHACVAEPAAEPEEDEEEAAPPDEDLA